jgi:hypothetical protein
LDAITYNPLKGKVDELIDILSSRAEIIINTLSRHFKYAKVKSYIDQFKSLHNQHIEALRKGNIIHAHEVLIQIYELSYELESDEFWTRHHIESPDVRYSLRPDAFQRGIVICGYMTGDMQSYSPRFPSRQYLGPMKNPSQDAVLKVYQAILSQAQSASETG